MRHAPQPLLWSPPASAAAAMSQRHPSASPQIDRSALKVGFRSENAAGAAADPSGDASSFLCSPMRREATRGCSARRGRRRLRRARVGRSGGTLCARHLPAPRRQPSRHRSWRGGRRRCRRAAGGRGTGGGLGGPPPPLGAPGQRWQPAPACFERGCLASSAAGGGRSGASLLFSTKQNSSQLRKLKRAGWKH